MIYNYVYGCLQWVVYRSSNVVNTHTCRSPNSCILFEWYLITTFPLKRSLSPYMVSFTLYGLFPLIWLVSLCADRQQERPCWGKFQQVTWNSNSAIGQCKWQQMTQKWIETVIATENCKYNGKIPTETWLPPQYMK